jgi:hypothetical protein
VWYDFNDKFYYGMGDGRANNITAQYSNYIYPYTPTSQRPRSRRASPRPGARCTAWCRRPTTPSTTSGTTHLGCLGECQASAIAEARFMRGTATGTSPHCGDAASSTRTPPTCEQLCGARNNQTDVLEFAIRDLEYAAKYLPKSQTGAGRVNAIRPSACSAVCTSRWPASPPRDSITAATSSRPPT